MKPANASMQTHTQGATLKLATCWKITKVGGGVLGLTDFNRDLTVSGQLYKAAPGYRRSALTQEADLSVDTIDLEGLLAAAGLTRADIRAGVYDYATVEIFLVQWADPATYGVIPFRKGRLGQVSPRGKGLVALLQGLSAPLAKRFLLELYSPTCRADLGDGRCQKDLTGQDQAGTVTSVTSGMEFIASAFPTPANADHWDDGKLTWLTGLSAGKSTQVRSYTDGTKTFIVPIPMPYAIQAGDTFSVLPGCDKAIATCRDKHNNVINFRGEPFAPGLKARKSLLIAPGGSSPGQGYPGFSA